MFLKSILVARILARRRFPPGNFSCPCHPGLYTKRPPGCERSSWDVRIGREQCQVLGRFSGRKATRLQRRRFYWGKLGRPSGKIRHRKALALAGPLPRSRPCSLHTSRLQISGSCTSPGWSFRRRKEFQRTCWKLFSGGEDRKEE